MLPVAEHSQQLEAVDVWRKIVEADEPLRGVLSTEDIQTLVIPLADLMVRTASLSAAEVLYIASTLDSVSAGARSIQPLDFRGEVLSLLQSDPSMAAETLLAFDWAYYGELFDVRQGDVRVDPITGAPAANETYPSEARIDVLRQAIVRQYFRVMYPMLFMEQAGTSRENHYVSRHFITLDRFIQQVSMSYFREHRTGVPIGSVQIPQLGRIGDVEGMQLFGAVATMIRLSNVANADLARLDGIALLDTRARLGRDELLYIDRGSGVLSHAEGGSVAYLVEEVLTMSNVELYAGALRTDRTIIPVMIRVYPQYSVAGARNVPAIEALAAEYIIAARLEDLARAEQAEMTVLGLPVIGFW